VALPDVGAIRAALVQKLLSDAPLMGLMTDGVAWDIAPQNATKFVKLSLADDARTDQFAVPNVAGSGTAYEALTVLILAVAMNTSGVDVGRAAYRIEQILDQQSLTVAGYTGVTVARDRGVDTANVDPTDLTIRWQSRGAYYSVYAAPA